ncbi:opioid-binding protein/cell adhesion molecule [Elysia marginata]|uniref:Opioid-binding protein/cell adhesion molecule n=1 Tax=Elysia marginata TaxID=1093978 RepID=A0AAV4HD64_9GAST|nr:opioid-binding protein/cell adhesion molecule [Elysia marginata]
MNLFYLQKIIWVKENPYAVLTFYEKRITDDSRMTVERPDLKAWNLHIRETSSNDTGRYQCSINTDPIDNKDIQLNVIVLPKIVANSSKEDGVMENDTVTLQCRTTGTPKPRVTWRRLIYSEDENEDKLFGKVCPGTNTLGNDGEILIITNITRNCGGIYQCVASNDRGDSVSEDIDVKVLFAPEVTVPSPRLGQYVGKETVLDCIIKASKAVTTAVWMKDGKEFSSQYNDRGKFRIDLYKEDRYTQILSLRLLMIEKKHFGTYTCVAKNPIAMRSANITLYDYSAHQKAHMVTTTSTTTQRGYLHPSRRQQHQTDTDVSGEPYRTKEDQHLKYETGAPNYGHVSADQRNYRRGRPSDKNAAIPFRITCNQLLVNMAALWMVVMYLKIGSWTLL